MRTFVYSIMRYTVSMKTITLQKIEPEENAYRYYRLQILPDNILLTEWGRYGHKPQSKSQKFPDSESAHTAYEKQLAHKIKGGYSEVQPDEIPQQYSVLDCPWCAHAHPHAEGEMFIVPHKSHMPYTALSGAESSIFWARIRTHAQLMDNPPVYISNGAHAVAYLLGEFDPETELPQDKKEPRQELPGQLSFLEDV